MDRMQASEKIISSILAFLMERGIDGFVINLSEEITAVAGFDEEAHRRIVYACFTWLEAEGLVRCSNASLTSSTVIISSPALTSFGFQCLGSPIQLDGKEISLGTAVKEVSSGDRSYASVGDFFGGLLGGFTKSIAG